MTFISGSSLHRITLFFVLFVLGAFVTGFSNGNTGTNKTATILSIDGPIGPATSDYIVRGLKKSAELGASLAILRMDTPGGLDTAMREIIRAILASPVPVVTYVAPSGARAASAGTYISYAAHIAAMSPGTNLGAATPVQVGAPGLPGDERNGSENDQQEKQNEPPAGQDETTTENRDTATEEGTSADRSSSRPAGIEEKLVNDAVAYIRSLAQLRGRNVTWAERAVTEAASLSAEDALEQNVIDVIAADVPALLAALDGRQVTIDDEPVTIATSGINVQSLDPDWRTKLLAVITNPNVASILMLIGVYGLILEFYSPGLVGPGVIGAICLFLALYAFHVLPVDYAGAGLMLLGICLMIAELFLPSFGIIGLGGVIAFVVGTIMLIDVDAPGFQVSWSLIGGLGISLGSAMILVAVTVMRSRRDPVVSGPEHLIGAPATILTWEGTSGTVRAEGETWRARSSVALAPGMVARVTSLHGLTVEIEPNDSNDAPRYGEEK